MALVAPSDIADIAGVTRAAVSNWRKRNKNFPRPVGGTPERPLFDRDDVVEWLRVTGKSVVSHPGERLWSVLNLLRGEGFTQDEVAQFALSLACARKLSWEVESTSFLGDSWDHLTADVQFDSFRSLGDVSAESTKPELWSALVRLTDSMESVAEDVAGSLVRAFNEIEIADLADVADYVLTKVAGNQIRAGAENGFVGSRVSAILARLAGPQAGNTLYDPACGVGEALLRSIEVKRSADDAGDYGEIRRVVGCDSNHAVVLQARQRAYLSGVNLELTSADILGFDPDPELLADTIVLEPPFGLRYDRADLADPRWVFGMPPTSSADLLWIEHAIAHLASGGRAYVVTPTSTLSRGGQEARIRAGLVRGGHVEAIFGLPGKLLPHVSAPLAIWVLCAGDDSANPGQIVFVDGSGVENVEEHVYSWLGAQPGGDVPVAVVSSAEVLAADANLTPLHWTGALAGPHADLRATYDFGPWVCELDA